MTSEDKKFVTDVERGWLTESLFDTIHRLCRIIRELEAEMQTIYTATGEIDPDEIVKTIKNVDELVTEIETVRSTLSNLQEEIAKSLVVYQTETYPGLWQHRQYRLEKITHSARLLRIEKAK